MTTACLVWNDGRHSGGRYSKLAFVKDGKIFPFQGSSIEGVTIVTATKYEKSGKWSNTDYHVAVAPNVGVWNMISRLHGTTFENQHSWDEALSYFVNTTTKLVSMEEFQKYVRSEYVKAAERFDEIAKSLQLISLDEKIEVSFGSPTNRQIGEGWWMSAKSVHDQTGKILGELTLKTNEGGWRKENIVAPDGFVIIDVTTAPGMHGGYVTVILAPRVE